MHYEQCPNGIAMHSNIFIQEIYKTFHTGKVELAVFDLLFLMCGLSAAIFTLIEGWGERLVQSRFDKIIFNW